LGPQISRFSLEKRKAKNLEIKRFSPFIPFDHISNQDLAIRPSDSALQEIDRAVFSLTRLSSRRIRTRQLCGGAQRA